MAKKNINVVVELHKNGVKAPLLKNVTFLVYQEALDEDGNYNPIDGEGSCEGAFQINVHADSQGYRELGRYFLGLAEYDVRGDPCFHEHHEGLISADGRTRLHIIVRKDDERFQTIQREQTR